MIFKCFFQTVDLIYICSRLNETRENASSCEVIRLLFGMWNHVFPL